MKEGIIMRIPYLVIINNKKSLVCSDKRKIKKLLNENELVKVYGFRTITKYKNWEDVYEINKNGEELDTEMFENNGHSYSKLGCNIMENIAKAEWNSSIKYPNNGWYICSVCGDITNDIDKCAYCGEYVCWSCANDVVNNEWDECHYCSYDCYRNYLAEACGTTYDPEEEHKQMIYDRMERILETFDKNELINILLSIGSDLYEEDELEEAKLKYESMSEKDLLSDLSVNSEGDIFEVLSKLYEDKMDEELEFILDGESFINNLDPNDPADEWYFED